MADEEGVDRDQVAGMFAFDMPLPELGRKAFQGLDLSLRQFERRLPDLFFQPQEALMPAGQVVPLPDAAHSAWFHKTAAWNSPRRGKSG